MPLGPGECVGRYRLEKRIGGGGFGDVYLASDPLLERQVAIKILRTPEGHDPAGALKRTLREARAASALDHPSIVTIHDVGEQDGQAFIVMEWIDGSSLRACLDGKPLEPARVGLLGRQIAAGLDRAHAAGIVHRDLKPENIMVRSGDVVKILDFGLARGQVTGSASVRETITGGVVGTPAYMAPEQLRGEPATAAADLFALGIILYEMATGRHPFLAEAPFATMQRILNADPAPPLTLADLPAGWNELLLQLLAKERSARAVTASDVVTLLEGGGPSLDVTRRIEAEAAQRTAHVVGRASELATLSQRWINATTRGGGFVMLAAEPGAGKTTIVQSFLRRLEGEPGTLVGTGRCSERLGSGEPYLPFLEAFAEMSGSAHGALVRAIIKSKAPTWFMQLFPASSTDSSFEQFRRELAGGSQERMRRELVEACEEIARSYALCVALEDLHWSDLATTELIAYLAKRIGSMRLLVLGTYRPSELLAGAHPLRPILLEMQGRGVALEIALESLSEKDVGTYIDLEFPAHRFPAGFGPWVYRKTEGSPLFMVDLLHYLVERQAIVESPRWQLVRPIDALEGEVPASVRSMIERKIETLSEEQRQWLTVAAVQGETFDSLTLSEVAGLDELRLEEQLEILHRVHRLVMPAGEMEFPDGSLTVRHKFVHVLYQDTLYQALTGKRKVLLHARVGEALERHHGARTHGAAAELALHFDRARQQDRAFPYYLRAAENAVSKFAHVQAEAYCSRALELADRLPPEKRDQERIPILKARGQVRFVMSRFEDATSDYQEMLASAERLANPGAQAEALCLLSEASFWAKQNEKLESHVERVLQIAGEHQIPGAAAQGHLLLALQRSCYGRLSEADTHLNQAEKEARAARLGPVLSRSLAWRSMLWFWRSDYERVLAGFKQVEALALENHDAFSMMVTYFHAGLSQANHGNLAEAIRTLEHGRQLSEKNNDIFWLGRYPNCVAWVHHEALDFPASLDKNKEAVVVARQTGFLEGEANSIINVGLARTELEDYAGAREAFLRTEEVFKQDDWFKWRYRMRLEMGWSELFLRQGDLAQARTHAEACRRLAQGSGARKHLALALRQLGRIALKEDRVAEAETHLNAAAEQTRDLQAPLAAWRIYATMGELYAATRRADQARTSFGTALQLLNFLAERSPEDLGRSILGSEQVRALEQRLKQAS